MKQLADWSRVYIAESSPVPDPPSREDILIPWAVTMDPHVSSGWTSVMLVVCGKVRSPVHAGEMITTSANQIVPVKFHGGKKNVVLYALYPPPPIPLWGLIEEGSGYETTQSYDSHDGKLAGPILENCEQEMDRPVSAGHRGQRRNSSTCDLHPQWGIAMETCETIG